MVNAGLDGHNEGLTTGLKQVDTYTYGATRGTYVLLGADSGVGKTTLADFMYLFNTWMAAKKKGQKLYVKYFSWELDKARKKARWVSYWIKLKFGIEIPSAFILGRGQGKLDDKQLMMVKWGYSVIEEMMKDVEIFDGMLHPTGVLNKIIDHFQSIGTIFRDTPKDKKKQGMITGYQPDDPNCLTVIIVDHMALVHTEAGALNTKQAMDRLSIYFVQLRNIFGALIVAIQQFNPDMLDVYRQQKKSQSAVIPNRLDFGDSKYTYRDADVVMGLVKPAAFQLKEYFDHKLEDFGNYFLALHILKNRDGPPDKFLPLFMNPIAGMFWDIPRAPLHPADYKIFEDEATRLDPISEQYSMKSAA
jgi:replicative DNA helicase